MNLFVRHYVCHRYLFGVHVQNTGTCWKILPITSISSDVYRKKIYKNLPKVRILQYASMCILLLGKFTITLVYPMVFILDGCSFQNAHIWSKWGNSIFWRHLATSKESSTPIFLVRKRTILIHTCATYSELPSYISIMVYLNEYYLSGKQRFRKEKIRMDCL